MFHFPSAEDALKKMGVPQDQIDAAKRGDKAAIDWQKLLQLFGQLAPFIMQLLLSLLPKVP